VNANLGVPRESSQMRLGSVSQSEKKSWPEMSRCRRRERIFQASSASCNDSTTTRTLLPWAETRSMDDSTPGLIPLTETAPESLTVSPPDARTLRMEAASKTNSAGMPRTASKKSV